MNELTDRFIAGLKGTGARQEIKDGRWPLRVVVNASGTEKAFQFRWKTAGKSHRVVLGHYPELKLARAREMALALRADVRAGRGPVATRRGAPTSATTSVTVAKAFGGYMEAQGRLRARSGDRWDMFRLDIEPFVGPKPLIDVSFEDWERLVLQKYQRVVRAGTRGTSANRLQALISAFLNWCCSPVGRLQTGMRTNPFTGMQKVVAEQARSRWLKPHELKLFFQCLPAAGEFAAPFELLLRTMARRSDILTLTQDMVRLAQSDLGDHLLVPVTKNGQPLAIPLHPSAKALIPVDTVTPLTDTGLWPSSRGGSLNPQACSKPMSRLRAAMDAAAEQEGWKLEHWTLHDLRRTGTTMLGSFYRDRRPLVPPHIKDRLLNHVDSSVRGKHYDQFEYYFEKQDALFLLNDELDRLRDEAIRTIPEKVAA